MTTRLLLVARLTVLAAVLVGLAWPSVPSTAAAQTPPAPQVEQVPAPIAQLLRDYSRGWKEKDPELIVGTLAPRLQEAEARAFVNAKDVQLTEFEVSADTQFSGNLASPRIEAKYPTEDVLTYQVDERSRIASETDAFVESGAYTFVRDPSGDGGAYDGWRLASKSDMDVLGFFSPHHLWDEQPVTVLRSKRFIVLTHADVADVVRPVLRVAESAYDHDTKFWPEPLTESFVVVAPSTTNELRRIMHETVALEKFVAFVSAGADRTHGWSPTGPRVFVHLDHLRGYAPAAQLEILAHELLHAVTRRVSGPKVPNWVEEGLANFGGGNGGRQLRIPPGSATDAFPSDDQFFAGPVASIQQVYDKAQIAIQVLDEKFGRAGLVKFYEELGSRRVVPGTEEYHIREAISASVGWSYDDWIAAWRHRIG